MFHPTSGHRRSSSDGQLLFSVPEKTLALHPSSSQVNVDSLVQQLATALYAKQNPQFCLLIEQNMVLLRSNQEKDKKIEDLTQKLREAELTLSLDLSSTFHSLSHGILLGIMDLHPKIAPQVSAFIQLHHAKTRLDVFFVELKKNYGYLVSDDQALSDEAEKGDIEEDLEIISLSLSEEEAQQRNNKKNIVRTCWKKLEEDITLALTHNKSLPVLDFPPETSKLWTAGMSLTSTLMSTASTSANFATTAMSIVGAGTTMGLWSILTNESALSTAWRLIRALGRV